MFLRYRFYDRNRHIILITGHYGTKARLLPLKNQPTIVLGEIRAGKHFHFETKHIHLIFFLKSHLKHNYA